MKDKELRALLKKAGIIRIHLGRLEYGMDDTCVNEKVNAIAKYLGIDFERVPEKVIAKKKAEADSTR